MKTDLLLLDAAPDPVSSGFGVAGLILVAVVVLTTSAATLVGFVFLLRGLLRSKARTNTAISAATQAAPELQPSSPNQP